MAKDDYFVIVYKILSYLYACLKEGEKPNLEYLNYNTNAFPINQIYWNTILTNIYNDGYIEGIKVIRALEKEDSMVIITSKARITTKGIEYLQENNMMKKTKNFLKGLKEIIPGA